MALRAIKVPLTSTLMTKKAAENLESFETLAVMSRDNLEGLKDGVNDLEGLKDGGSKLGELDDADSDAGDLKVRNDPLKVSERMPMTWQTLQVLAVETMNSKELVILGSCSCSCLSPGKIQSVTNSFF